MAKIGVFKWSLRFFIRQVGLALRLVLTCHFCFRVHTHEQVHIYMVRDCVVEEQAEQEGSRGDNKTVSSAYAWEHSIPMQLCSSSRL